MQVRASPDIGKEPCVELVQLIGPKGLGKQAHVLTALRLEDHEHGSTGRPDVRVVRRLSVTLCLCACIPHRPRTHLGALFSWRAPLGTGEREPRRESSTYREYFYTLTETT
jgi:hypothetical protein